MIFKQPICVMYLVMMVSMCRGHIGNGQLSLQHFTPRVYCGRFLARALAILCYDESFNEKRSESGTMYNAILAPYYKDIKEQEKQGWPWMPHQIARSMNMPSRSKRHVVSECCEKACDINELMSYC